MAALSNTRSLPGHARWTALGTSAVLRCTDPAQLARARAVVESELATVDAACSRFRSDSELSRANKRAGRPVQVSAVLAEAVQLALDAAALTGGAVDPTVGKTLELCGYDRDWQLLPAAGEEPPPQAPALRVRAGWHAVEMEHASDTLQIPSGVSLDLGATAKAWAADRGAAAAQAQVGCGVLLSLGGDIACAGRPPAEGWRVRVTDDHRAGVEEPGQTVSIRSGGLASSSTTARRWSHAGHTMHHIIDPATGVPARGPWRAVSVAAASCAQANIATTAALVKGPSAVMWLHELALPARLHGWDGSVRTLGDWPADPLGEAEPRGAETVGAR